MLLKALFMWGIGQALTRAPALRNHIGDFALLAVAMIAAGLLSGALVVGLFYGEYLLLTRVAELSHVPAFAITWLTSAFLLLLSKLLLGFRIRRVLNYINMLKKLYSPVSYYSDPVIDSFLDGFNSRKNREKAERKQENSLNISSVAQARRRR